MIVPEDLAQAPLRLNHLVEENKTGFDRVVSISRAVTVGGNLLVVFETRVSILDKILADLRR